MNLFRKTIDNRHPRTTRSFTTSVIAILFLNLLVPAFAGAQDGGAPTGKSPTASGVKHTRRAPGPIVIDWKIKMGKGKEKVINGVKYESVAKPANVNLTVNDDGSWNMSGSFPQNKGHDLDVAVGLKAHDGAIVIFHFSGSLDHPQQFNKSGHSDTLKDNFKSFKPADWYANYRQPLNSEGIAKEYAKREASRRRSEEERKREEEREKQEIQAEVDRQQAAGSSAPAPSQGGGGGGGSTFSSVMGDVTSALGTVSSVGNAIAGLF